MSLPASYDVKLGTFLLRLARNSQGVPALEFLDAPNDPGGRGGIVSIYYDNWHLGWGRPVEEIGRPLRGEFMYLASPGLAIPHGAITLLSVVNDSDGTAASLATPIYKEPVSFPFSFVETNSAGNADMVFYTTATQMFYVVAGSTQARLMKSQGGATALPAGSYWVGPWANYRAYGNWFAGICGANGVSQGIGYLSTGNKGNAGAVVWEAGMTSAYAKVSQICPGQGGLFAIRVTATSDRNATWDLLFTDAADPASASSWVVLAQGVKSSLPTGLVVLGRFIFVFCYRGEIGVFAGGPPFRVLVQPGVLTSADYLFGRYWALWGATGELIFTSRRALYALDLDSLSVRDISPVQVEGPHGRADDYRQTTTFFLPVTVSASAGYLLIGPVEGVLGGSVYALRSFPQLGPRYVPLARLMSGTGERVVWCPALIANGSIVFAPTDFFVVGLVSTTSGGSPEVRTVNIPTPRTIFPQSRQSPSSVVTGAATGRSHARKLAFRLRLTLGVDTAGSTSNIAVYLSPDVGNNWTQVTTVPSPTGAGIYSVATPALVGRAFALRIDLSGAPPRLNVVLPVVLDCLELPEPGDRIRLAVTTAAPAGRSGIAVKAKEELLKALRDLRGQVVSLEFLDAQSKPATYSSVVVEEVDSAEAAPNLVRSYPEAVAQIVLRVL
jgi:hypothetical protein